MVSFTSMIATFLAVAGAIAKPAPKLAEQPVVTYLGTQGPILCTCPFSSLHFNTLTHLFSASGAWTSKGIVYTSGTVPSVNGTIVGGGIEAQTVRFPFIFFCHFFHLDTSTQSTYHRLLGPSHQEHSRRASRSRHVVGLRDEDDSFSGQHFGLHGYERGVCGYAARSEACAYGGPGGQVAGELFDRGRGCSCDSGFVRGWNVRDGKGGKGWERDGVGVSIMNFNVSKELYHN